MFSTAPTSTAPVPSRAAIDAPAATPLLHTHAHNDYLHEHPLFDALSHRFSSVEADVWLTDDGRLLVGHDKDALHHLERTLQALYLDPLQALVHAHGGHVYADSTAALQLLVDVKNTGTQTYLALDRLFRGRYGSMLTSWTGGVEQPGAIRVIISGDRDRTLMESQTQRYAAYDGRLSDLGTGAAVGLIPLISDNCDNAFAWKGVGEMPGDQRDHLQAIVARAHADGQEVRFSNTPDRSPSKYLDFWREELSAGVDWLNTDLLGALETFLTPFG